MRFSKKLNHGFYSLLGHYVVLIWPLLELMDHLCMWVETFCALFFIKVILNPRSPSKRVESNGCHKFSRLVPVELSRFRVTWVDYSFWMVAPRILRVPKAEAHPFGIGSSWLDFLNLTLDSPSISNIWEVFGLRVSGFTFHLHLWNTFTLVWTSRGVIQILALNPLLSIISLKLSKYVTRSEGST